MHKCTDTLELEHLPNISSTCALATPEHAHAHMFTPVKTIKYVMLELMLVFASAHSWLHLGVSALTAIAVHNQPASWLCVADCGRSCERFGTKSTPVHLTQFQWHSTCSLCGREKCWYSIQPILAIICQNANKSVIRRSISTHNMCYIDISAIPSTSNTITHK